MNVLLSIKPKFASLIFSGTKKYEYRKVKFAREDVEKIIVYVSSPEKKIVGEFTIKNIVDGTPETIWDETKDKSGIDEDYFFQYAGDREKIYAIEINQVNTYAAPVDPNLVFDSFIAPQSFVYLGESEINQIEALSMALV